MSSNYDALAGGVSAWGLGWIGRRGGFGSLGLLGTAPWWLRIIRGDSSTVTADTTLVTADNSK